MLVFVLDKEIDFIFREFVSEKDKPKLRYLLSHMFTNSGDMYETSAKLFKNFLDVIDAEGDNVYDIKRSKEMTGFCITRSNEVTGDMLDLEDLLRFPNKELEANGIRSYEEAYQILIRWIIEVETYTLISTLMGENGEAGFEECTHYRLTLSNCEYEEVAMMIEVDMVI